MSVLVKYPITDTLTQGLFLPGTKAADFTHLDDECEPGHIVAQFAGTLEQAESLGMTAYQAPPVSPLLDIVIHHVDGALSGFDDNPGEYTVPEGVNITATGTLNVPDQKFRVPFYRQDTGRVQPMIAEVVNGEFTLVMRFRTGGEWRVNADMVNSKFDTPMFHIDEYVFHVV